MFSRKLLFTGIVFLASFLLFLVEPISGRQLLPALGGSAAVWITCLVFFQTVLVLGYALAHWLSKKTSSRTYFTLLLLAVAAAVLSVFQTLAAGRIAAHPVLTVFSTLSLSIGMPFLLLSATSPLLQAWWARAEAGVIPYHFYALSNVGSMLALVLYPTAIEPHVSLHLQRVAWCVGFTVFTALSMLLAVKMRSFDFHQPPTTTEGHKEVPVASRADRYLWVLLPMGAAMQLSAVTSYLTANVAAIPLLWILPLIVYLITLILSFQFTVRLPLIIVARTMLVLLAALAYWLMQIESGLPLSITLLFFMAELFFACLFCHSAASALRPRRASEATLFYLLFAAGGALGSFLVGIASPMIFRYNLDLPITILVTALLALAVNWKKSWGQRLLWGCASVAMFYVACVVARVYRQDSLLAVRNFYGSLRVTEDKTGIQGTRVLKLMNGNIRHGTQIFDDGVLRRTPTTYYAPDSGIGLAVRHCCEARVRNIGVIGLGAGTLAAYGRPGDHICFYEINPAVLPIARETFRYLQDTPASVEIVEGDARSSLARESPRNFDVLAVDAFSGDAIPVHLLTADAMVLYRRHLAPHGILAFHISNQYIDLGPALALLAASAGMQARSVSVAENLQSGAYASTWMLMTADPTFFDKPEVAAAARMQPSKLGLRLWTDDYSALLPLVRW